MSHVPIRLRILGETSHRDDSRRDSPWNHTRFSQARILTLLNIANHPSRKSESTNSASRDILSNVPLTALLFWLPILVLLVSGFFQIGQAWRTAAWVVALAIMGASCVVNALRCGRVHCYVAGPFFLAMAIIALSYGFGVIPLGTNGWNFIGGAVLIGALILCCLPEAFLGRYRRASEADR